jgi:hypothetical protein
MAVVAMLVLAGLFAAPPSPRVFGPSAAARALSRGDFESALALPAADAEEGAYIRARVALAEGRVDEAAALVPKIDPESRRARELAWLVAHARRDRKAIAVSAERFCKGEDLTGRSCADAELYGRDLAAASVTLAAPGDVPLIDGAPFPVAVGQVGSLKTGIILDTGASQTVLSRKAAKQLGIKATGAGFPIGVAAGGAAVKANLAILPELKLGPATVRHLPVLVMDLPDLDDKSVSVILSPQQALDGLVVTLDFNEQKLRLARSVDPQALREATVVPYLRVGFEMAVRASVGAAKHALFVVDTGMSWSYALARSYAAALGLGAGPATPVAGAGAGVAAPTLEPRPVLLGSLTLEPTLGGVLAETMRPDSIQVAGFLGNGLWSKGALTIDTIGRRLLLRLRPAP